MLLKRIFLYRRLRKLPIIVWGLTLAGLLLVVPAGCGVKAPPVVPDEKPAVVERLTHTVNGTRLTLAWHLSDHSPSPDFYTVYQSKAATADKPCEGCPLSFERLLKITAGPGNRSTHTLTLDKGFHYRFRVSATTASGLEGPFSETVRFTYE